MICGCGGIGRRAGLRNQYFGVGVQVPSSAPERVKFHFHSLFVKLKYFCAKIPRPYYHVNPKIHEIVSAEIMYNDNMLKEFFNDEERKIIKEAIEDHRASSNHEPRNIYGKIVSTADRNNTVEACLRRSYSYNKKLHPEYDDEQIFEDCHFHLNDKFGENGYAKFFFKDEEYEKFLTDIRTLLSDKDKFIETQKNYINDLKAKGKIN